MAELTTPELACLVVIVAVANADPTVSGIVGARVYDGEAPLIDGATGKEPAYPWLTVAHMSTAQAPSVGGDLNYCQPLFLISLWGATLAQRVAVFDALIPALRANIGQAFGVSVGPPFQDGSPINDSQTLPGVPTPIKRHGRLLRFPCQVAT